MGNGKVDTLIYPAVCGPLDGHEAFYLFDGPLLEVILIACP